MHYREPIAFTLGDLVSDIVNSPKETSAPKSGLVVVSVSNFESGIFSFPPEDEPSSPSLITVIDQAERTIRFSTLQSQIQP